jgi:uroporphyrinogen III methyltransferase/synthase
VDVVTFTSGAIATAFVGMLTDAGLDAEKVLGGLTIASIGPVTTDALEALGFSADIEAPESTMPALALAVGARLAEQGSSG